MRTIEYGKVNDVMIVIISERFFSILYTSKSWKMSLYANERSEPSLLAQRVRGSKTSTSSTGVA